METKTVRESNRSAALRKTTGARGPVLLLKAIAGCEDLLEAELVRQFAAPWLPRRMAPVVTREEGLVRMEGLLANDVHEVLFRARTAEDVEWLLHDSRCHDARAFTRAVQGCGLEGLLPPGAAVRARVDSVASHLFHEGGLKDDAERALKARGFVPGAEGFEIVARLKDNRLRISLSLTARTAGRRGYKASHEGKAPLREEQAAACFEAMRAVTGAMGARGPWTIWVPFAGTGTLGFEGALAPTDATLYTPARVPLAETLSFWSAKTWSHLGKKQGAALASAWTDASPEVVFLERDPDVAQALHRNVASFTSLAMEAAGASPDFEIHRGDFFTWEPTPGAWDGRDVVVPLNPPYGVRLHAAKDAHEAIAARLVALRAGVAAGARSFRGILLCPDETSWRGARRAFGHERARITRHFTQGGFEIRALIFELG